MKNNNKAKRFVYKIRWPTSLSAKACEICSPSQLGHPTLFPLIQDSLETYPTVLLHVQIHCRYTSTFTVRMDPCWDRLCKSKLIKNRQGIDARKPWSPHDVKTRTFKRRANKDFQATWKLVIRLHWIRFSANLRVHANTDRNIYIHWHRVIFNRIYTMVFLFSIQTHERLLSFSIFPMPFRFDRITGSSAHVLSRNIAASIEPKSLLTINSYRHIGYDTLRHVASRTYDENVRRPKD